MIKAEKYIFPLITLILFLGLWQMVSASGIYTSYQLPAPSDVLSGLIEVWSGGTLWGHISISLYRFGIAYALAAVSAVILGLVFGWYTRLYQFVDPFVQVLRPISPIAWFPLAVLWFKTGNPPAIFIIFLSAFFPVLLSTISAVRGVNPLYLKVAENFGARGAGILTKVILPAAFPGIMVGLHVALGTGWIHLVAGEMLGAQSGLGFLIIDARNFLRTDLVLGGMLVIGILGLGLDRGIGLLENMVRRRWGYNARNGKPDKGANKKEKLQDNVQTI